jgi:MFS family permease
VPIALVILVLVRGRIPESFGPRARVDVVGLLLQAGGAFGLVWGLVRGNSAGWSSLEVLGGLVGGVVLLAIFARYELRADEPMLPIRLFRSRGFSAGNISGFLLYGTVLSAVFFIAQYLQVALGYGPLGAGVRVLPWTASLFIVAPISGALINRIGERRLLFGGLFLQAIGLGWVALIAAPDLAYPNLIAPLVIAGCGVSLAMPASQNSVLSSVPPSMIGKASGTFNTVRQLGGATGVAVLAAVFAGNGGLGSAAAFSDGFGPAIGAAAVLSLCGAVAGLFVVARKSSSGEGDRDEQRVSRQLQDQT